jgi:hypothetical protein
MLRGVTRMVERVGMGDRFFYASLDFGTAADACASGDRVAYLSPPGGAAKKTSVYLGKSVPPAFLFPSSSFARTRK